VRREAQIDRHRHRARAEEEGGGRGWEAARFMGGQRVSSRQPRRWPIHPELPHREAMLVLMEARVALEAEEHAPVGQGQGQDRLAAAAIPHPRRRDEADPATGSLGVHVDALAGALAVGKAPPVIG
jgi:hypothetical protein